MAVNNTISVKEYALGTTASQFPITFEFTTDDSGNAENIHCQRAEKNSEGQYINSEELSEGIAGDFTVSGGNVQYLDDATQLGKYLVIYRSTPVTQLTDFIDNGNYSLEDIERALDKLTFILQERTGTPVGTYINVGVSLFFASLLQLTQKKDVLENLFTWTDIDAGDRPGLAATIRSVIDAVTKSGDETIDGHKTFTYSPVLQNDPQTNNDATRKSYVDSKDATTLSSAKTYTDNHVIDTAHLKQTSGAQAVTTATIRDANVTLAKLADNSVSLAKMRKGTASVSITSGPDSEGKYNATWDSGSNKIPYALSSGTYGDWIISNGGIRLKLYRYSSGTSTVYYVY